MVNFLNLAALAAAVLATPQLDADPSRKAGDLSGIGRVAGDTSGLLAARSYTVENSILHKTGEAPPTLKARSETGDNSVFFKTGETPGHIKARAACDQLPKGTNVYGVDLSSAAAFRSDKNAAAAANGAQPCPNYTRTFVNQQAAIQNPIFALDTVNLASYDVNACAAKCNAKAGCTGFNIFFSRDPTLTPAKGSCPDPAATVFVKCAIFGSPVDVSAAVNKGQTLASFQNAIAGSNGYTLTKSWSVPGFGAPVSFNDAIISAGNDCNGVNTYMGVKTLTTGVFDPNLCSAACSAQNDYNRKHPPKTGPIPLCRFFNTYIISKNGIPEAQYCAMYSQTWDASYATSRASTRGSDTYVKSYSSGWTNATDNGLPASCKSASSSTTKTSSTSAKSSSSSLSSSSSSSSSSTSTKTSTTSSSSSSSSQSTTSSASSSSTSTSTSSSTTSSAAAVSPSVVASLPPSVAFNNMDTQATANYAVTNVTPGNSVLVGEFRRDATPRKRFSLARRQSSTCTMTISVNGYVILTQVVSGSSFSVSYISAPFASSNGMLVNIDVQCTVKVFPDTISIGFSIAPAAAVASSSTTTSSVLGISSTSSSATSSSSAAQSSSSTSSSSTVSSSSSTTKTSTSTFTAEQSATTSSTPLPSCVQTSAVSCPSIDGKYGYINGTFFKFSCNNVPYNPSYVGTKSVSNLNGCISACLAQDNCKLAWYQTDNAMCWMMSSATTTQVWTNLQAALIVSRQEALAAPSLLCDVASLPTTSSSVLSSTSLTFSSTSSVSSKSSIVSSSNSTSTSTSSTYSPTTAPPSSSTSSIANSISTSSVTTSLSGPLVYPTCVQGSAIGCPAIDGTYGYYGGVAYKFSCGFTPYNPSYINVAKVTNLEGCMANCRANPSCQVGWLTDSTWCWLFSSVTTYKQWDGAQAAMVVPVTELAGPNVSQLRCDVARVPGSANSTMSTTTTSSIISTTSTTSSAVSVPSGPGCSQTSTLSCPAANGTYSYWGGKYYKLSCGYVPYNPAYVSMVQVADLPSCIAQCRQYSQCTLAWLQDGKYCWLMTSATTYKQWDGISAALMVSEAEARGSTTPLLCDVSSLPALNNTITSSSTSLTTTSSISPNTTTTSSVSTTVSPTPSATCSQASSLSFPAVNGTYAYMNSTYWKLQSSWVPYNPNWLSYKQGIDLPGCMALCRTNPSCTVAWLLTPSQCWTFDVITNYAYWPTVQAAMIVSRDEAVKNSSSLSCDVATLPASNATASSTSTSVVSALSSTSTSSQILSSPTPTSASCNKVNSISFPAMNGTYGYFNGSYYQFSQGWVPYNRLWLGYAQVPDLAGCITLCRNYPTCTVAWLMGQSCWVFDTITEYQLWPTVQAATLVSRAAATNNTSSPLYCDVAALPALNATSSVSSSIVSNTSTATSASSTTSFANSTTSNSASTTTTSFNSTITSFTPSPTSTAVSTCESADRDYNTPCNLSGFIPLPTATPTHTAVVPASSFLEEDISWGACAYQCAVYGCGSWELVRNWTAPTWDCLLYNQSAVDATGDFRNNNEEWQDEWDAFVWFDKECYICPSGIRLSASATATSTLTTGTTLVNATTFSITSTTMPSPTSAYNSTITSFSSTTTATASSAVRSCAINPNYDYQTVECNLSGFSPAPLATPTATAVVPAYPQYYGEDSWGYCAYACAAQGCESFELMRDYQEDSWNCLLYGQNTYYVTGGYNNSAEEWDNQVFFDKECFLCPSGIRVNSTTALTLPTSTATNSSSFTTAASSTTTLTPYSMTSVTSTGISSVTSTTFSLPTSTSTSQTASITSVPTLNAAAIQPRTCAYGTGAFYQAGCLASQRSIVSTPMAIATAVPTGVPTFNGGVEWIKSYYLCAAMCDSLDGCQSFALATDQLTCYFYASALWDTIPMRDTNMAYNADVYFSAGCFKGGCKDNPDYLALAANSSSIATSSTSTLLSTFTISTTSFTDSSVTSTITSDSTTSSVGSTTSSVSSLESSSSTESLASSTTSSDSSATSAATSDPSTSSDLQSTSSSSSDISTTSDVTTSSETSYTLTSSPTITSLPSTTSSATSTDTSFSQPTSSGATISSSGTTTTAPPTTSIAPYSVYDAAVPQATTCDYGEDSNWLNGCVISGRSVPTASAIAKATGIARPTDGDWDSSYSICANICNQISGCQSWALQRDSMTCQFFSDALTNVMPKTYNKSYKSNVWFSQKCFDNGCSANGGGADDVGA